MADLDLIHDAIANLHPGARFGDYLWVQPNGEDGDPEGEPVMLKWDDARFGAFDLAKVRAECRRLAAAPPTAPDNPTLSDWRCGLALWKRPDGTLRLDEVTAKVADLVASGHPLGRIARERLEYANNVTRAQLVQLAGLFGFSSAEIEQSLWRAERVRQGDLSGIWPLPAGNSATA